MSLVLFSHASNFRLSNFCASTCFESTEDYTYHAKINHSLFILQLSSVSSVKFIKKYINNSFTNTTTTDFIYTGSLPNEIFGA